MGDLFVPSLLSLWSNVCIAAVPWGGHGLSSACEFGHGVTVTSADGDAIVDSWNCGVAYNKTHFQEQPTVRFSLAEQDPERLYTLVVVDPNKPGLRPNEFFLHWIVSYIKGKEFFTGKVSTAKEIAAWVAPDPPVDTGYHRYQFFAFEHNASKQANITAPADRTIFNLNSWLQSPGQEGSLCGPVGGVEFLAATKK